MNEAETRAELIDPLLAAAGWGVVEGSRIRREYPITLGRLEGSGRRGKALTADYVLEMRNTKLATMEAKARDKPVTEGVAQTKNYAGRMGLRFAYASNGEGIYGIDMATGEEGEIAAFPTPQELWDRLYAATNIWRDRWNRKPATRAANTPVSVSRNRRRLAMYAGRRLVFVPRTPARSVTSTRASARRKRRYNWLMASRAGFST